MFSIQESFATNGQSINGIGFSFSAKQMEIETVDQDGRVNIWVMLESTKESSTNNKIKWFWASVCMANNRLLKKQQVNNDRLSTEFETKTQKVQILAYKRF